MTQTMTLSELRKHDGPLFIANNTPFLQTCHERVGESQIDFELEPKGSPDSVIMISKHALEVRGLQKAWRRGDLIVSTDESLDERIALEQGATTTQSQLEKIMSHGGEDGGNATVEVQEPPTSKSLVQRDCLSCQGKGCGSNATGKVIQSQSDVKAGLPPLCPSSAHEAHEWAARATTNSEGEQTWAFDKVVVTAPQRGEAK